MEPVQCGTCNNYIADLKCLAFPDGIPREIMTGEIVHNQIVPGQIGNYVHESILQEDLADNIRNEK